MRYVLAMLQGLLLVAYPLAVYFGLSRFSARGVGLVLLVLALPGLVRGLKGLAARRHALGAVASLPVVVALVLGLTALLDDPRLMLAYPALVNLVLLGQFAWTLRRPPPMVERFARLQVDDLSPAEVVYCRRVTWVWAGFFLANGLACALLAAFASRAAWALYTGLVSYLLIGALFGAELLVRKARFRRFGDSLLDRVLARVLPPEAAAR